MTFALEVLPGGHWPEALSVFLPTARKDPEPLPSPVTGDHIFKDYTPFIVIIKYRLHSLPI